MKNNGIKVLQNTLSTYNILRLHMNEIIVNLGLLRPSVFKMDESKNHTNLLIFISYYSDY